MLQCTFNTTATYSITYTYLKHTPTYKDTLEYIQGLLQGPSLIKVEAGEIAKLRTRGADE